MTKRKPESAFKEWASNPFNWAIVMFMAALFIGAAVFAYQVYSSFTEIPEQPPAFTETYRSPLTGVCYEYFRYTGFPIEIDCELIDVQ